MKTHSILLLSLASTSALADYALSQNKKEVVCYGADNLAVTLNAKRTTLQITVEGESNGARKIIEKHDDKRSSVSYATNEGALTLSDDGDTFLYDGDSEEDAFNVDCR
jgi:hypothetical protein